MPPLPPKMTKIRMCCMFNRGDLKKEARKMVLGGALNTRRTRKSSKLFLRLTFQWMIWFKDGEDQYFGNFVLEKEVLCPRSSSISRTRCIKLSPSGYTDLQYRSPSRVHLRVKHFWPVCFRLLWISVFLMLIFDFCSRSYQVNHFF